MQKLLPFYLLLFSFLAYSQSDGRFGLTLGTTNYITDSNILFSKSGIGYKFGLISALEFSKHSELFFEINYNKHFVKLIGRENELSAPQDLKFNLENIAFEAVYNYNYIALDDFRLGINAGPSFSFFYEYVLTNSDSDKGEYLLDPFYVSPRSLTFDSINEQISFNLFLSIGLSAQYNFLMVNLKYYRSITDPYRSIPLDSFIEIKGKDSYLSLNLTFFLY